MDHKFTVLHIPKTAGTALKNALISAQNKPFYMAVAHSQNIHNTPRIGFCVRDPLERFCSGFWERVTNPQRKLLNEKAPAQFRRTGYNDLSASEKALFSACPTPNDLITAMREAPLLVAQLDDFVPDQRNNLGCMLGSITWWLGDLNRYKQLEHRVDVAFDQNHLSDIMLTHYDLQMHTDPFLARSRAQFDQEQSYWVSEENTKWFQQYRHADYELLEYIKSRHYYLTGE